MISDQALKETVSDIFLFGKEATSKKRDVGIETLTRYVRWARERGLLTEVDQMADRRPQVLVLDIETLPILGTFWRPGKQFINHEHILEDVCLLSYSVKWLFEPDVYSDILTAEEAVQRDDERILKDVWKFVDKADIIIAHNGVRFDMSVLNTQFIIHRMNPPSPYQVIDTLKVFYREANFSSNKQGYLNKILKLTEKMEHEGLAMWHKCMKGDQDALDTMLAYNEQDIMGLEELYVTIRPWIKSHPNMALYYKSVEDGYVDRCHRCLSTDITWLNDRPYVTPMNRYSSYRCNSCGGVGRARSSEVDATERKHLTSSIAR